jgi:hypothetical protein
MYSKCIVSPLIKTPIAITASNDVRFLSAAETSPPPRRSEAPAAC